MNKKNHSLFLAFALILSLFQARAEDSAQWTENMKSLSQAFEELVPLLSNPKEFSSPSNKEKIEKSLTTLSKLSHEVKKNAEMKKLPVHDQDPSLQILSESLEEDAGRALSEYKNGFYSYSRSILRTVVTKCIACHSRSSSGPQFTNGSSLSESIKSLPPLDRAQFNCATRRFDQALEEYKALISDRSYKEKKEIRWEKAVRQALFVAVRVKEDPELSLQIVSLAMKAGTTPHFFYEDLKKWKASLIAWQKEKNKNYFKNEDTLIQHTRDLFEVAQKKQKFPIGHSAEIEYLRTSASAHQYLSRYPNGKYLAEAFYIAGSSYEVLSDLDLWYLHENYYESCIKVSPKSSIAKKCYHRYESSVYLGYSGSGGVFIPDSIKSKLKTLRTMAGL